MWWQRTATIHLREKDIQIVKIKRNLLGRICSRQEDRYGVGTSQSARKDVPQPRPDGGDRSGTWLMQPERLYAVFTEFLLDFGLQGWQIDVFLPPEQTRWQDVVLGTEKKKEAQHFIAEEELLGAETPALCFAAAAPRLNDSGLFTWTVGAYDKACLQGLCRAAKEQEVTLRRLLLVQEKQGLELNLLPPAYQRESVLWLRPAAWLLTGSILLLAGAGLFCQYQLGQAKQVYTDQVYPREEKLKVYNERQQAWQQAAAKLEKQKPIPWTALLVALAETKPAGVQADQVRKDGDKVVLQGQAPADTGPRQWQKALQQQKMAKSVNLGKLQRQKEGGVAFSLEVGV